jgi:CRP/FNR family transcriptional regulator, cyclic AMP receptor protein
VPDTLEDYRATLSQVSVFAGLTDAELTFLAQRAVPRRCEPGEMIFAEGERCSGMYVIQTGSIRIFKSSPGGREQVLSIDGPGESVAEVPVFDGGNYPASANAVGAATLLLVRKQDFHALCLEHPEVALKVLRVVGSRLRKLVGMIEELSFTTVRNRLAAFLLRLAKQEGKRTPEGIEFPLPAGNQELAAQIGTVRELISRNLSRLQAEGMIRIDGRTVTVLKEAVLEEEAKS